MQVKRKEAIPCANQNIPLTSPSAGSAARCAPGCPTAAGVSTGTSAPGTPPSPSLPDKAPGIYAALGPDELLRRMVYASGNASAAANSLAAAFANFLGHSDLYDVNRLRAETITNAANKLCRDAAELLACVDLILYAAEYGMGPCLPYGTRGGDLDNAYSNTLQNLLREAKQKGLSPDYTSAPQRASRLKENGLRRLDVAEGGNNRT